MILLYEFPVSHYCEKVRWALLHKRLPHKRHALLPGLHRKKTLKLTGQTSVPVLKDGRNIVAGSADILSYLDNEYPRFPLTPEKDPEKAKALAWEHWADAEIGPSVRVLMYSVLTEHPDVMVDIMGQHGPWYKNLYLKNAMPKIIDALLKGYKLDEAHATAANTTLTNCVEKITEALADKPVLVGGSFSRADLSVAALLAPIFRIGKYGMYWPESMPSDVMAIEEKFSVIRPWVETMYAQYHP